MSCEECDKMQDIAFNKNINKTVPIAYYRIENADIAIVGCTKHVKIAIDRLNKR